MADPTDLGEQLYQLLGLGELRDELVSRLDRIERRLERLNITPADLDTLEQVRASLQTTDTTLDAIEPEGTNS